jgi:hypothetical protein
MPLINFEGVPIPDEQVAAFRAALRSTWEETLDRAPREWNRALLGGGRTRPRRAT